MSSSTAPSPEYFPFPFPPYDIQDEFMRKLYSVLDAGGVGIFESPTGTGKSLSLICGSLTWLRDFEKRQKDEQDRIIEGKLPSSSDSKAEDANNNKEEDWINEFARKRAQQALQKQIKEREEKRQEAKLKLQQIRSRPGMAAKRKHSEACREDVLLEKSLDLPADGVCSDDVTIPEEEDVDKDVLVAEYHSGDEQKDCESSDEEDIAEEEHVTKIYYCSRTHSQLAQFVKEIQKSPFSETSVVTLGSRQNYCINEDVKKLKSINRMNEKCLDLQKKKKDSGKKSEVKVKRRRKANSGCPFYDYKKFYDFRDLVMAEVQDIEDLVSLGQDNETCPYYGTRFAIPPAEVVVLPYNILLHHSTREAYGIKLPGNIVIIDEAHNLIDTISNIYSIGITGSQISSAHSHLSQYHEKFKNRLKAKNIMYIKQILFLLSRFLFCLGGKSSSSSLTSPKQELEGKDSKGVTEGKGPEVKLWTINDFLFTAEIDNLNLFKIRKYCERSLISKKLSGFIDKYNEAQADGDFIMTSPLQHIEGFIEALTNADKDGRIVVSKTMGSLSQSSIKFLLLNPAVHFTNVVQECRAVVVAGGTMHPTSEFKEQLFAAQCVSPEKIIEFSCGHVIPDTNLLAVSLSKGPTGIDLDFTYQSRESYALIEELGRILVNICSVVPGGVVCFFSSYDYEQTIYSHWEKCGILGRLEQRKRIFREPRKAGNLEQVLSNYSRCIKRTKSVSSTFGTGCGQPTGAMLLSVVGGKMSEGINFSDDLGRCIVMVGLPYPNIKSPALKEKMDYLTSTLGPRAGQIHYENLCMKAVNQSIGRAIRHQQDYATILLLDQRYSRENVSGKLPGWISDRLSHHARFGPAFASVRKFFVDKRPLAST